MDDHLLWSQPAYIFIFISWYDVHIIYTNIFTQKGSAAGGDDKNSVFDDGLHLKPILSHKIIGSKP